MRMHFVLPLVPPGVALLAPLSAEPCGVLSPAVVTQSGDV